MMGTSESELNDLFVNTKKAFDEEKQEKCNKIEQGTRNYKSIMKIRYKSPNEIINSGSEFQKIYRDFYKFRGSTINKNSNEYFKLLADEICADKTAPLMKEVLERLLKELFKAYNSVELSFGSKLMHTVNSNLPIYDKNVCKKLGITYTWKEDIDKRFYCAVKKYELLNQFYAELLKSPVKSKFEQLFDDIVDDPVIDEEHKISSVKKIDFLLWAAFPA